LRYTNINSKRDNKAVLTGEFAVPCNLQPATAGANSAIRAVIVWSGLYFLIMKNGSRAVENHEPCQAGNRAALSGKFRGAVRLPVPSEIYSVRV